jgi:hypothetical protein
MIECSMRFCARILGLAWVLTGAALWAQQAAPKPGPALKPEPPPGKPTAYYLATQQNLLTGFPDPIGFFILEAEPGEQGRVQFTLRAQLRLSAFPSLQLPIPKVVPDEDVEVEKVPAEVRRTLAVDEAGKMTEVTLRISSVVHGSFHVRGRFDGGVWAFDLRDPSNRPKTVHTTPADPNDPPLPELLTVLSRQGALKPGAKVERAPFRVSETGELVPDRFVPTVGEAARQPAFDGEERLLIPLDGLIEEGKEPTYRITVGEDGFADKITYDTVVFTRVKDKEKLGPAADFWAEGRRDIFESSLAEIPEGVIKPKNGPPPPPISRVQEIIDGIKKRIARLPNPQVDLDRFIEGVEAIWANLVQLRERKDLKGDQQKEVGALVTELERKLPRKSIMDLIEARGLLVGLVKVLEAETKTAMEDARRQLDLMKQVRARPTLRGTPEEARVEDLIKQGTLAIGRKVLADYVKDVEVRGIIYARSDRPEPVQVNLSILGAPLTFSEQVLMLHPRGLCVLSGKKLVKQVTYREGEYLKLEGLDVSIQVKEVHPNKVVLEGEGAVVELPYPVPKEPPTPKSKTAPRAGGPGK